MYVKERFVLNDYTQDFLRSLVPPFGYNGFGELVFYRTYSRMKCANCRSQIKWLPNGEPYCGYCDNYIPGQEDWVDCVIRVVQGTLSIRKDWYIKNRILWDESFWQKYANRFAHSMFRMHWLPPGRGMWAMGTDFVYERGSMALNNCMRGTTRFLTSCGVRTLEECVGSTVEVLCQDNVFREAEVKSFGSQVLRRVILKPHFTVGQTGTHNTSKFRLTYDVTRDHRWILADGESVTNLRLGDKVKVVVSDRSYNTESQEYIDGFAHGIIYGDGTRHTLYQNRFIIRLCDDPSRSNLAMLVQCSNYRTRHQAPCDDGDVTITIVDNERNLKALPADCESLTYMKGFVEGWLEADSHEKGGGVCLDSINEDGIEWLIERARLFGYAVTGLSVEVSDTNFGPRTRALNRLKLARQDVVYKVIDIEEDLLTEEVYCVTEPVTHSFTLAGGVHTGNCGYCEYGDDFGADLAWMMDALMMGVGVGFKPIRNDSMELYVPHGVEDFVIPDSREGWCDCSKAIVDSYLKPGRKKVRPIYDLVRPEGLPIRGFGGISSGPKPLQEFHERLVSFHERYRERKEYDSVRLKADCGNCAGVAVVAGNVRRSAEIMIGSIHDEVFLNLKNYALYPERGEWGWASNNSVELVEDRDFEMLGEVARRAIRNGEPGYINRQNMVYARIGKKMKGLRKDTATGLNPCGESCLEDRELCCQVETYPTMCSDEREWLQSCEYATLYASTVSLLPTHQPSTNRVIARNRRITVGLVDYTGWKLEHGVNKTTKWLRRGYDLVRSTNKQANEEAGVPISIRVTTIKPGGTSPKLPGRTSGSQHPNFHHMIRRIRVAKNHTIHPLLVEAGLPYEQDVRDKYTDVFEYPILQGPAKPADQVTIWEQAMNVILLQREWSDNAVACTLNFRPMWPLVYHIERDFQDELAQYVGIVTACNLLWSSDVEYVVPERYKIVCLRDSDGELTSVNVYEYDPKHEENDIEAVLSAIAPLTKSVSLLPHSPKGAYAQMPEEGISPAEYEKRLASIRRIDWSKLSGSDGIDERFCSADSCERVS